MPNSYVRPIITGVSTIIVVLLSISLCLSLLLHFTSLKESSIEILLLPISLLTLFIGGLISGYKSGTKGWYVGALTGLAFILLSWILSFLGFDLSFSLKAVLIYLFYLLLAMLGGIIGVNLSPHRN
ncbi:TIGR04086 family membrane protein [Bacillus horti]|uniref:Membrane protein (TIGR04086 family) n=1 Tax=Caldalkalibacillus horti TaxID=77523 RepID=A0ABT9VTD4_9BACI|nr:TIGR04086 family membrane protein [Bacillus horti]MDQ0164248.1 putative membrane protein (TIGR04086 family) [Bacillus horti]